MKTPFDIHKAAQAAHYFVRKEASDIKILKLVKLLYLADRLSLEKRQVPVVGGSFYSLKHGPVTSEVLNLIDVGTQSEDSPWEKLISDRENHAVGIRCELSDYDALSKSELRLLDEVWDQFGNFDQWKLRDWTHQHCEEWSDPNGGRNEISGRKLGEAFGWESAKVEDFVTEIEMQNKLHQLLN
jgi:uncharacterized phage-associated protein